RHRRERRVGGGGRFWGRTATPLPSPATARATARASTTSRMPQPTLETAWPTAPRPDHVARPMSAAIPPNQATTPARLTIGAPIRTTFSTQPAIGSPALKSRGDRYDPSPVVAYRGCGLPRRFDVERLRCPKPEGHLVGGTLLRHQRRASGFAAEPFVFHKHVRRELRRP